MSTYEVELRGLLDTKQKNALKNFLAKNGKLVKKYTRKQWIFGTSHRRKIDVQIKETNGEYIFSLKTGAVHHSNRKEISIPFPKEKAEQALDFLKLLGKKAGVIAIRKALVYMYGGIEWAIVEVPKHSFYFEAEKIAKTKAAGEKAKEEIRKTVERLGLNLLNGKETIEYIQKLDKEANVEFKL